VKHFQIDCKAPLGELIDVQLYSKPFMGVLYNQWFCDKITISTPEGDKILFPCYNWLDWNERLALRPAKGRHSHFKSWPPFIFTGVMESSVVMSCKYTACARTHTHTHTHRHTLLYIAEEFL